MFLTPSCFFCAQFGVFAGAGQHPIASVRCSGSGTGADLRGSEFEPSFTQAADVNVDLASTSASAFEFASCRPSTGDAWRPGDLHRRHRTDHESRSTTFHSSVRCPSRRRLETARLSGDVGGPRRSMFRNGHGNLFVALDARRRRRRSSRHRRGGRCPRRR